MWRVLYDGLTEIRCLNWACLSDRQRNIYYRNVYHCYQFVLASIYINIYFVLASIYSSMFWDFSSKYRYTGITGIFFPVYRYRNFLIPNIPIVLFIMHFMIMNTCEIIMNNHTCEIIDFISCRKINKPVLYFKLAIIKQNNSVLAWLRHENWQSFGSFRYKVHCTVATLKML